MSILFQAWDQEVDTFLQYSIDLLKRMCADACMGAKHDLSGYHNAETLAIHNSFEKAWSLTGQLWGTEAPLWSDRILNMCEQKTSDFLDIACSSYYYRTNAAPPSDFLWNNLENRLDPCIAWRQIEAGLAFHYPTGVADPNNLSRILNVSAVCRPLLTECLSDNEANKTIWNDYSHLESYFALCKWSSQSYHNDNHLLMVRLLKRFPSAVDNFYYNAPSLPVDNVTIEYALEHCPPNLALQKEHVFSWLATLQAKKNVWLLVENLWPRLANYASLLATLVDKDQVGKDLKNFYIQEALASNVTTSLALPGDDVPGITA